MSGMQLDMFNSKGLGLEILSIHINVKAHEDDYYNDILPKEYDEDTRRDFSAVITVNKGMDSEQVFLRKVGYCYTSHEIESLKVLKHELDCDVFQKHDIFSKSFWVDSKIKLVKKVKNWCSRDDVYSHVGQMMPDNNFSVSWAPENCSPN